MRFADDTEEEDFATVNRFVLERAAEAQIGRGQKPIGETQAATKLQSGLRGKTARKATKSTHADKLAKDAAKRMETAGAIFYKHDADESGFLSFKEMTYALREMVAEAGANVKLDFDVVEKKFDEAIGDRKMEFM